MINRETGEKVLDFIEVVNPSLETNYSVDWRPSFTMTMENCEFSQEALGILFGTNHSDNKNYKIEATGTRPVMVQARKHRIKRINKKWLKRYGYKEIQVPVHMKLDSCTISPYEFGENCFCVEGKVDEII